jgi:hypothetical protein
VGRTPGTADVDDRVEPPGDAGAHAPRVRPQPQCVDEERVRRSSQWAHGASVAAHTYSDYAEAAAPAHWSLRCESPCPSSMRMSGVANGTATEQRACARAPDTNCGRQAAAPQTSPSPVHPRSSSRGHARKATSIRHSWTARLRRPPLVLRRRAPGAPRGLTPLTPGLEGDDCSNSDAMAPARPGEHHAQQDPSAPARLRVNLRAESARC